MDWMDLGAPLCSACVSSPYRCAGYEVNVPQGRSPVVLWEGYLDKS